MYFNEFRLFGIDFLELGTIISDSLMGLTCLFFFKVLKNEDNIKHSKFLRFFFLFLGISSLVAAWAHGLFLYFDIYLHLFAWVLSGLAFYFLQLGTAVLILNDRFKNMYLNFIKIELLIYTILLFFFPSFVVVKINFAVSLLLIIFPIYFFDYLRTNERFNLFVLAGILLAILPGLFHKTDFTFGYILNMNDLSHFVLILCIYFLYLGLKIRFFEKKEIKVTDVIKDF